MEDHKVGVLLLGDVVSNYNSLELVRSNSSLSGSVGLPDLCPRCPRGILLAVADDDIDEFPAVGAA